MHTLKDRMSSIFYFRHRLIVKLLLCVGGGIALLMVYLFLFLPIPVTPGEEPFDDTSIRKDALERVLKWSMIKQEQGKESIHVPSGAFAVPSTLP